jgi:hypothetical protein
MADPRRPLTEGIIPPADRGVEQAFLNGARSVSGQQAAQQAMHTATTNASGASLSTRIRPDFVTLLKRASLERKLSGIEPNSLRDILEQAVEPWLRANGYLP